MNTKLELTLSEEMLGTKAANPEVFATFIASQHPSGTPQRDELDQPENKEAAGTSIFHEKDGRIGIYNYQIKGFFKDACQMLRQVPGTLSAKLVSYKSRIDGLLFVEPRFIFLELPESAKPGVCERPLRAETMQGPRVSVCRSQTVPAGSKLHFTVTSLTDNFGKEEKKVNAHELLTEWLNYGKLRGLGQWRNSGKGIFTWQEAP